MQPFRSLVSRLTGPRQTGLTASYSPCRDSQLILPLLSVMAMKLQFAVGDIPRRPLLPAWDPLGWWAMPLRSRIPLPGPHDSPAASVFVIHTIHWQLLFYPLKGFASIGCWLHDIGLSGEQLFLPARYRPRDAVVSSGRVESPFGVLVERMMDNLPRPLVVFLVPLVDVPSRWLSPPRYWAWASVHH
jgi:hypothetical protein